MSPESPERSSTPGRRARSLLGAWASARFATARVASFPLASILVASTVLPSTAQAAPEFTGAERCGTCHEAEYQDWRRSGHALAFARLSKVQQRDATCRSCHTMVPGSEEVTFLGVQCESCHGAGGMYAPRYIMKDEELSKLLGLQAVSEETCLPCHAKDTPSVREFKFTEKLELVNHGKKKATSAEKSAP